MFPTKHNFLDSLKQVLHQGIQRSLETLGCHNRGEVGGFLASSGWGPGMPCKCTEATARRMISFQMSAGAEAVVWRQVLNCWGPGGARRAGEARTAEQPGWARVRTHTPHATRHTPHAGVCLDVVGSPILPFSSGPGNMLSACTAALRGPPHPACTWGAVLSFIFILEGRQGSRGRGGSSEVFIRRNVVLTPVGTA